MTFKESFTKWFFRLGSLLNDFESIQHEKIIKSNKDNFVICKFCNNKKQEYLRCTCFDCYMELID